MGGRSSSTAYAPPSISPAKRQHSATLIFLHGLGDSGHSWVETLRDYVPDYVKIVCPHARDLPVTINGFHRMPAWFDILGFAPDSPQDEVNISRSSAYVETLIAEEVQHGIDSQRVLIGGFSQGGAIALYTALNTTHKLAGVVALSCWLPMHARFLARGRTQFANSDTPLWQSHGRDDDLLPFAIGQLTSQLLKGQLGLSRVEFRAYEQLGHSSSEEQLEDLHKFVQKAAPKSKQQSDASPGTAD